jgi:hypothetical protein
MILFLAKLLGIHVHDWGEWGLNVHKGQTAATTQLRRCRACGRYDIDRLF